MFFLISLHPLLNSSSDILTNFKEVSNITLFNKITCFSSHDIAFIANKFSISQFLVQSILFHKIKSYIFSS